MAFPSTETLTSILAPVVAAAGLDVEGIKTTKAGKKSVVAIAVDADIPPTTDTLEKLSQDISQLFDEAEERGDLNFGPGYTLEVTTPGLDHPLTLPRHWRRNQGRLITLFDGNKKQTARLGALNDTGSLAVVILNQGKQRIINTIEVADYPTTMVEIEFAKPAAEEAQLAALTFDEAVALQRRED